jgi:hypothetical protein
MNTPNDRVAVDTSDQLHPWIYRIIIALALLLILSAWGFSGSGNSELALAVVTVFILIAIAIPLLLWVIWRKNGARPEDLADPPSFTAWQASDFETCEKRLKGRDAAVQVLLPIAAVAVGMAVFALVLHFDVGG